MYFGWPVFTEGQKTATKHSSVTASFHLLSYVAALVLCFKIAFLDNFLILSNSEMRRSQVKFLSDKGIEKKKTFRRIRSPPETILQMDISLMSSCLCHSVSSVDFSACWIPQLFPKRSDLTSVGKYPVS